MAHIGTLGSEHSARRHLSPFLRHMLQMVGVMAAGMLVAATVFLIILGMTWDEATLEHPQASLLVIAAGMTVPMVAWMLRMGMGTRNTMEMAAAMALPVIPFLCLVWFDVTESAECGVYCLVSLTAMIGLMLHRRPEYSTEMHGRRPMASA